MYYGPLSNLTHDITIHDAVISSSFLLEIRVITVEVSSTTVPELEKLFCILTCTIGEIEYKLL